jgi:hypothetical protein
MVGIAKYMRMHEYCQTLGLVNGVGLAARKCDDRRRTTKHGAIFRKTVRKEEA